MIKIKSVLFVVGHILFNMSFFMCVPTLTAFLTGSGGFVEFAFSVFITHIAATVCLAFGRAKEFHLKVREMFVITTLVWIVASAFAALPFVFINHISFTDAYFETMSGVTTTGSTVLSNLDDMAPAILLWRSILQWLGGIGFIVMGVAILPFLNVGGMRLFQTESSDWSEKSAPKTRDIASGILLIYLFLTVICALCYWLTGMNVFESINHAMTTLSTGGYSTADSSMNNFSNAAHWVATIFMFIGGLPFLLLIKALKRIDWRMLVVDEQIQGFTLLVLLSASLTSIWLISSQNYSFLDAVRISLFNVISVLTTTGFGLDDFTAWGSFTSVLFTALLIIGGCSGSTAGGAKIFRFQIAFALLRKQIKQLIHPSGVFIQRYSGKQVNEDIARSVVAFTIAYILTILILAMILGVTGLDTTTCLTGAMTAVANVGPGMGDLIGPTGNFAKLSNVAKWALSIGMLMGRLEILTILVLFSQRLWRD